MADTTDWRLIVESRLRRARADLATLEANPDVAREFVAAGRALAIVDVTLAEPDPWWRKPAAWWSGWRVERSWRALHDAEVAITAADPQLAARLPAIRERVAGALPAHDQRRRALAELDPEDPPSAADRAVVTDAVRAAFDHSDEVHAAARALRNKLFVAAVLLAVLVLSLGVLGSVRPSLLPMCAPVSDAAPTNQPAGLVCAAGGSGSSPIAVWLVLLLGAVGAAVAAVVLLVRRRPSLSPYVLAGYQAGIKVLLGSLLAVVGVLALGAGLGEGITEVRGQATLLLWSVVLGYAQQLGTRLLDNYADRVLDRVRPLPPETDY